MDASEQFHAFPPPPPHDERAISLPKDAPRSWKFIENKINRCHPIKCEREVTFVAVFNLNREAQATFSWLAPASGAVGFISVALVSVAQRGRPEGKSDARLL